MIEQDKTPTAVVIGEESLLIQCVETLGTQGFDVAAVATGSSDIVDWAQVAGLSCVANDRNLQQSLAGFQFDYLFSITNLRIVPDEVLAMAGIASINFHDGPLPAYAGLYATSWALLNRESSHGVSWHTMDAEIDTGQIIKRATFDIAEDETAYTLNVKCYENAITSFEELVAQLRSGAGHRGEDQDLSQRSYFGKYQRPAAAATLDWRKSGQELVALVRALDFGPHENPLGRAKVRIGDRLFIVAGLSASASSQDHGAGPGTVVEIADQTVSVAVSDGLAVLESVIDEDFQSRPAAQVMAEVGVGVGDVLAVLDEADAHRLGSLNEQAARSESNWVDQVASLETIELPYQRRAHESDRSHMETVALTLPAKVRSHLEANHGDQGERASFLLSAFSCYLSRLTGQERFHLSYRAAIPEPDRELQPWFWPELPVLCEIPAGAPLAEALATMQTGFDTARTVTAPGCDVGLRHPEIRPLDLGWRSLPLSIGVDVRSDEDLVTAADRDLTLTVNPVTGQAGWVRDAAAYPADVFTQIERQFVGFLEQIVDDDGRSVAETSLLSAEQYHRVVVDWNATDKNVAMESALHQLFSAQAEQRGEVNAIVHENTAMSYGELDRRTDQLAQYLHGLGVGPGSRVGVFMDRGLDMIVGLLGIMKAGGAYVPLDPGYPQDRIGFMIEDSNLAVILTQTKLANEVPVGEAAADTVQLLRVDGDWPKVEAAPQRPVDVVSGPDDLAYLIYTSGSTGKPKGVMVTHGNVINFFAGMDDHIEYEVGDTWLTVTSLSFDISVLEIFWSLTRGLELVIFADRTAEQTPSEQATAEVGTGTASGPQRDVGFSLFYFASDESEAGNANKYELLLEGAKFADQNGFEAVWTPERHFYAFGGLYPNPSVTSAAIAAVTDNVGIRAGSCVLPLHHPARVAEEWSVVDNISNGRVGIAFAAGWQPVDFVLRPENFADRKGALIRDVATVQQLWRGDSLEMEGPDGSVNVQTLPRPVQPELPIWLTVAGNPDTFAAAGAGGFNVLTHLLGQSVDEVEEKITIYRNARREAGHEGDGHVTLMLHTYVGDDVEQVRELVRPPMIEYLRSSVALIKEAAWSFPTFQQKAEQSGMSPLDVFEDQELTDEEMDALLEHAFNRYFDGSALFGTEETCMDMVARLARSGVDEIACQVDFGLPAQEVLSKLPMLNELRLNTKAAVAAAAPTAPAQGSGSSGSEGTPATAEQDEHKHEVEDFSIAALIDRHEVSHFQCTPSMGSMLVADDGFRRAAPRLKMCLMGGEAFPQSLAKEITDIVDGTVLNVYGPTETTIWSSVHTVENGDRPVSIGRPLANQQMYVVDRNLEPCPVGVAGELLIGGDGVTRGYLDRPELTDERFIPDRFRPKVQGAKLYRTGDLVRHEPDGSIEFLGRMDFQVKVRGYRIELGEIEARLNEHPAVREAVVSAREDTPGDQRLVAYVIPGPDHAVDSDELREHLGQHLPEFMVPAHYVSLDRFPLTPNKKTDRKALPPPDAPTVSSSAVYVAPEQGAQQDLVKIWQQMLGVARVGVDDNFFDLGGHSLLAVQLNRTIKAELGIELSITDVFRFPTIGSLTNHLEHREEATEAANTRVTARAEARRKARADRRGRRRG